MVDGGEGAASNRVRCGLEFEAVHLALARALILLLLVFFAEGNHRSRMTHDSPYTPRRTTNTYRAYPVVMMNCFCIVA